MCDGTHVQPHACSEDLCTRGWQPGVQPQTCNPSPTLDLLEGGHSALGDDGFSRLLVESEPQNEDPGVETCVASPLPGVKMLSIKQVG